MPRPALVLDMEMVGVDWDALDETTRSYLIVRQERRLDLPEGSGRAEPEHEARRCLGLSPGTGRIVAIALVDLERDRTSILCEGTGGWRDAGQDETRFFRGDEADLLREFWRILDRFGRVVTYNGRNFDIPYAYVRSALHDIRPSRQLLGNRFSLAEHCDLAEVLTFFGAAQERFSLDYWCRRFGIPSPKEAGIDGSMVNDLYREGRIEDIATYCLRDAVATAELFRRLEKTLVELYGKKN